MNPEYAFSEDMQMKDCEKRRAARIWDRELHDQSLTLRTAHGVAGILVGNQKSYHDKPDVFWRALKDVFRHRATVEYNRCDVNGDGIEVEGEAGNAAAVKECVEDEHVVEDKGGTGIEVEDLRGGESAKCAKASANPLNCQALVECQVEPTVFKN